MHIGGQCGHTSGTMCRSFLSLVFACAGMVVACSSEWITFHCRFGFRAACWRNRRLQSSQPSSPCRFASLTTSIAYICRVIGSDIQTAMYIRMQQTQDESDVSSRTLDLAEMEISWTPILPCRFLYWDLTTALSHSSSLKSTYLPDQISCTSLAGTGHDDMERFRSSFPNVLGSNNSGTATVHVGAQTANGAPSGWLMGACSMGLMIPPP